jgi:hypothetical protein
MVNCMTKGHCWVFSGAILQQTVVGEIANQNSKALCRRAVGRNFAVLPAHTDDVHLRQLSNWTMFSWHKLP